MAEYIEREKLTKHIEDEIEAFGNPSESQNPLAYGGVLALRYCKSVAVTLPTADVVEVVRCQRCRYAHFVRSCSKYMCEKGCGELKYSTDFCSYGERKERK